MAKNGLEVGDSIKGSDTFEWFRGETADVSPGRRKVKFDDLVTYLNSTSVLTAFA